MPNIVYDAEPTGRTKLYETQLKAIGHQLNLYGEKKSWSKCILF